MKKILVTGANSYVGKSLKNWLDQYPYAYSLDAISVRGEAWKEKSFSDYNIVFHVAGIAHVSSNPKMEEQYYKINRDLTVEVAEKAKNDGVKQFIFMSSIIVYGESSKESKVIDSKTQPNPSDFYGKSKLQAEEGISLLEDEKFKVVIIRPPMIYGKDSKGNYPKLAKVARKLPIFPNVDNQRSILHINNLSEFIRLMIEHEERGLFFPQNNEYVKTSDIVKTISEVHGKKIRLIRTFNPILIPLVGKIKIFNKVFGNLVYEMKISDYKKNYRVHDFKSSIEETELGSSKK
ncbi:NAD-dependent epimerase/dehydratase family protein [Alkalicoccus daliensis]|uniref:UDP-glucose 4-epimerase n=1 Tax=Alkalicoccus daliensis TaxID=745820 RepID=A0A1H0GGL1_9BACI|nr:NAD-dependent epimerase/dehydratase family protein [Alkalicoccus daliensis]SDO05983.1 UDP-glucose 4-epimerase [Alkalicoccus daliensis]